MTWLQHEVVMVILCCFHMEADCITDEEFRNLAVVVRKLEAENKLSRANEKKLQDKVDKLTEIVFKFTDSGEGFVQNLTIEERVAVLEGQVVEIEEDVTGLDEDVNFLFDETVIQDQRLLNLEEETSIIDEEVEVLKDTATELDFRVTALEENGGSGNSSVGELEVRVETLEVTVSEQETRLTTAESQLEDLDIVSDELETRVTAAEENIQGLQATDVNHDERISALEENGGSGGSQNNTIAFHSVLTLYDTIPLDSTVMFNSIILNEGNGYDSTTGVFTVPPGGDGVYYFSIFVRVDDGEAGGFEIRLNDDVMCTTWPDHSTNGASDFAPGSCSAVVSVVAGDEVEVVYEGGTDETPLQANAGELHNGFNGFRI